MNDFGHNFWINAFDVPPGAIVLALLLISGVTAGAEMMTAGVTSKPSVIAPSLIGTPSRFHRLAYKTPLAERNVDAKAVRAARSLPSGLVPGLMVLGHKKTTGVDFRAGAISCRTTVRTSTGLVAASNGARYSSRKNNDAATQSANHTRAAEGTKRAGMVVTLAKRERGRA